MHKINEINLQLFAEPDLDLDISLADNKKNTEMSADDGKKPESTSVIPSEADIKRMKDDISAAIRAKEKAESALDLERKAHGELKRAHMSADQINEERERLLEEKGKLYDRQLNAITIERIFGKAGLVADDYEGLLNLIVGEDADKSEETANAIVGIISKQVEAAVKAEREMLLKGTPTPPHGGAGSQNPNIKTAQELAKSAAQTSAETTDVLKHYT